MNPDVPSTTCQLVVPSVKLCGRTRILFVSYGGTERRPAYDGPEPSLATSLGRSLVNSSQDPIQSAHYLSRPDHILFLGESLSLSPSLTDQSPIDQIHNFPPQWFILPKFGRILLADDFVFWEMCLKV